MALRSGGHAASVPATSVELARRPSRGCRAPLWSAGVAHRHSPHGRFDAAGARNLTPSGRTARFGANESAGRLLRPISFAIVRPPNFVERFRVKRAIASVVCAAGLVVSGAGFAQGDIEAGRDKAFTCTGCHSAPGLRNAYPGYSVPKIGGQHADYLVVALKAYQNKERSHPTMQAHATGMSEKDMADIAAYFSSLGNE
ncbi:MAG: cytochrome c [Proteobacteria bacterium]|nr:MAG: cytochrome c [Pseudomonadota bacterium]